MATIKKISAREILDSRGNPTVEVDLTTEDGVFRSSVPSGASTGTHEALELRDKDKRYGGKGVLKAVRNVNEVIAMEVVGLNPEDQNSIDGEMLKLDGTENKSKLGANAMLAVSMAVTKAGAAAAKLPVYRYISKLTGEKPVLPLPMVLVLEGGKHADRSSDLQEFMVMPKSAQSFSEAIKMGSEIYHAIGKVLKEKDFNINVGYEGAYGPSLGSNEKTFEMIVHGIESAGYRPGEDVKIAVDCAASEFYQDGKYVFKSENKQFTAEALIDFYGEMAKKYPVYSIEDGLFEDDWQGWQKLYARLGGKIQIVGDDLTVTNSKRLKKAIDEKAVNALIIKVNQIGTITETLETIQLAKKHAINCVVSHRSAETEDPFIADLAVGTGAGQCKFGAPSRSERTAKYNELLRIEAELGENASIAKLNY